MKTRSGLSRVAAMAALAISVVAFAGTPGAVATQGQPVIAGAVNEETLSTSFCLLPSPCLGSNNREAVRGETDVFNGIGVSALSTQWTGVDSYGLKFGVRGASGDGGTGVYGHNIGTTGIGVWGQTDGVGSAVYGQARTNGVGINGDSDTGIGVRAKSASGKALEVLGKATFSRSGTATVAAGKSSAVVSGVDLSAKSLVLVTPQKNIAGVYVQAAVPNVTAKTVTVYLNKAVATSYPVAWMIIEKP